MKQVMNYHKDNGLLNMIRRTDPMIIPVKRNPNIILQIYNGNDYQVYDQYYIPGVINEVICNGRANKKK